MTGPADLSRPTPDLTRGRAALALAGLILLVFAAVAPTIPWMDFCDDMENFNVATAMETVRDGNWMLPTLNARFREAKPPLTHWITSAGLLTAPGWPEWGARWPSLAMGCLALIPVYWIGRTIGDRRLGLLSAAVFASSLFFLKFARRASYDLQLTVWVACTLAFLAEAVFRDRRWVGWCGAGLCAGLAILTKGPVVLAQTFLPVLLFPLVERFWLRSESDAAEPPARHVRSHALPIAAGVLLMLAVCMPWVLYAVHEYPHLWQSWRGSIQLKAEVKAGVPRNPENTLGLVPHMIPWALWCFVGAALLFRKPAVRDARAIAWVLFLVVLPAVVMAAIAPVRVRYLMPLSVPMSVLAARGLITYLDADLSRDKVARWLGRVHWLTLALIPPGVAIVAATVMKRLDGTPWLDPRAAAMVGATGLAVVALNWAQRSRWRYGAVLAGVLVMLLVQAAWFAGNRYAHEGQSVVKPIARDIVSRFPTAEFYEINPLGTGTTLALEFNIYAGKTVRPVESAAALKPETHPQVIVIRQRPIGQAEVPLGAVYVGELQTGSRHWKFYVLRATGYALR